MAGIDLKTLAGRAALALALGVSPLALGACGGSDDEDGKTDGGGVGGRDGGVDTGDDERDGGGSRDDGGDEPVDAGGGVGRDTGVDAAIDSEPPSLSEGTFRQVGRDGQDVRIDVTGRAGDSAVSAMMVRIVNTAGEDVALKDLDDDGDLDPGEIEVALSVPLTSTKADGSAFVVLSEVLLRDALVDHVLVTLLDAEKQASEELELSFTDQPVLSADEACDRSYVENRCGDDLGCKGSATRPTCRPGEAPTIDKVGYFVDALGARMLIAALDPDDDIASYKIVYRGADGEPVVAVDTNADQSPDASELEFEAEYPGEGGKFFVRIDLASEDLTNIVSSISVTVTDRGGRSSAVRNATKAEAPARANNAVCDTRTFDRCNAGSVCVPGATAPAGRCLTLTNARTTACNAALELNPSEGINSVQGVIGYPSLWDVPANSGCSSSDPEGRPERLVKLTLTEHADLVSLSTNFPFTNFDTTLYAMRSCGGSVPEFWCVDDLDYGLPNYTRAVLELEDLDAGEYFIVVDSFSSMSLGNAFELGVTLQ